MQHKRKAKRNLNAADASLRPDVMQQKGFGTEMPPQKKLVDIYFDQKGLSSQARTFYDFYQQANWCSAKGTPYRNWKLLATDWMFNFQQALKLRRRQRENRLL